MQPDTGTATLPPPAPTATVVTPPGAPPAEPAANHGDQPVYAGKYHGPEALERATREITDKLGLPKLPDGALYGQGKSFADIFALENDYKAKEGLLGRLGNATKPAEPAAPKAADPAKPAEMPKIAPPAPAADPHANLKGREKVLAKAGLSDKVTEMDAQWKAKGELLPEHYAGFEKAGHDRDVVDDYFRLNAVAQESTVGRVMQEIDGLSGGPDKTQTLIQWAGQHYTAAETADLNKRLASTAHAVGAMKQIMFDHSRFVGSNGAAPLASGTAPSPRTTAAYSDPGEYKKARDRVLNGLATAEERSRFQATDPHILMKG